MVKAFTDRQKLKGMRSENKGIPAVSSLVAVDEHLLQRRPPPSAASDGNRPVAPAPSQQFSDGYFEAKCAESRSAFERPRQPGRIPHVLFIVPLGIAQPVGTKGPA